MRIPTACVWIASGAPLLLAFCCGNENAGEADAAAMSVEDASSDSEIDTRRTRKKFVSVTLSMGWGPCSTEDCGATIGVEASGVLVLEDSWGEERFDLDQEEYDAVLDIIFESEMLDILSEPVKWACPPVTDQDTMFTISWTDTGKDTIFVGGCMIREEYREHPFNLLGERLDELVATYLICEPYIIPRGWNAGMDPYPTRPLCSRCGEPCGATYTYE